MTDSTRVATDEAEQIVEAARALGPQLCIRGHGQPVGNAVCGRPAVPQQRARYRLSMTHLTDSCVRAVALMYKAGGGSSLYATPPLDRHFRDIHTLNQHVVVSQKTYQSAGRMFLGLEPGEPFF